jgi:hypothetical protein
MQLKEMEGRDDIGVSRAAVGLTTTELGSNDRLFATVRIFGEMALHAGLDATAARLDSRAGFLHIGFARFDNRDAAKQSRFARL